MTDNSDTSESVRLDVQAISSYIHKLNQTVEQKMAYDPDQHRGGAIAAVLSEGIQLFVSCKLRFYQPFTCPKITLLRYNNISGMTHCAKL